jgi:hypothetical protein
LSIINFFSSSIFFSLSSESIAFILSCHIFSVSFLYCSRVLISSSSCWIISGVTVWIGFLFLALFCEFINFCYSYFTLFCFRMNCSWFFLNILSDYISFSFNPFVSSLTECSYFFKYYIFSSYSSSFLIILRTRLWSCLILSKLFFYCSKFSSSVFKYLSSSSLASRVLLL